MCRVMVKTFLRIRLCLILPFYLTVALVEREGRFCFTAGEGLPCYISYGDLLPGLAVVAARFKASHTRPLGRFSPQ